MSNSDTSHNSMVKCAPRLLAERAVFSGASHGIRRLVPPADCKFGIAARTWRTAPCPRSAPYTQTKARQFPLAQSKLTLQPPPFGAALH